MVSYLDSYNNLQALQAFSHFAQKQGKPLMVSWSINDHEGLHDGTSTMALFVGEGTYLDPANKQQPYVQIQLIGNGLMWKGDYSANQQTYFPMLII